MNLSEEDLLKAVKGQLLYKQGSPRFRGVCADSRVSPMKDYIFFALKGPHFDGADFAKEALARGAGAVVLPSSAAKPGGVKPSHPYLIIEVKDTLRALSDMASFWRKRLNFKVIGITGSSGKTSTKNFLLQLLSLDFKVQAAPKSFNNRYGVPLSVLSVKEGTDFLVQEIGMNQKGEIKELCKTAFPSIKLVTSVGHAHIGKLGTQEAIAREKEQIYLTPPLEALCVFNLDNPYTQAMYQRRVSKYGKGRVFTFSSREEKACVCLKIREVGASFLQLYGHIQGKRGEVKVKVAGPVHLHNVLAAATLARAAGLVPERIWERLSSLTLPSGRNQWIKLVNGTEVLFDAYNGSPESVKALLSYFLSPVVVKKKKALILGDFLELGNFLPLFQKQIARVLSTCPVECLWLIGSQAQSLGRLLKNMGFKGKLYLSLDKDPYVADKFFSALDNTYALALKASRKMKLEEILWEQDPQLKTHNVFAF